MDKCWYQFRYLLFAEVLEVGVVKVHEGVLEGSGKHGTMLKQFLIQKCKCKMDGKLAFVQIYILLAEVLEVGVVEVHEGALEDSG